MVMVKLRDSMNTLPVKEEDQLSKGIQKIAYQANNGELAWKKGDIPQVVKKLSKLNIAILGGEVWAIDNKTIYGILPLKDGVSSVFHWSTEREKNEEWNQFVKRSIQETITAVNNLNPEDEVREDIADKLYYNLTFCNKANYKKM